jgi:hypothetical protein
MTNPDFISACFKNGLTVDDSNPAGVKTPDTLAFLGTTEVVP